MDNIANPTRRYLRFSLRTLLVLVTLVCFVCGSLGWTMNWKRQRQVFREREGVVVLGKFSGETPRAIYALWLLYLIGERPATRIFIVRNEGHDQAVAMARQLFPEATIGVDGQGPELWLPLADDSEVVIQDVWLPP